MLPENGIPTHAGLILRDQFLGPLGLTQVALAEPLGVPVHRMNETVRGKRGITSETSWLPAQAFDTTPEFWLNLQTDHDPVVNRPVKGDNVRLLPSRDSKPRLGKVLTTGDGPPNQSAPPVAAITQEVK